MVSHVLIRALSVSEHVRVFLKTKTLLSSQVRPTMDWLQASQLILVHACSVQIELPTQVSARVCIHTRVDTGGEL